MVKISLPAKKNAERKSNSAIIFKSNGEIGWEVDGLGIFAEPLGTVHVLDLRSPASAAQRTVAAGAEGRN